MVKVLFMAAEPTDEMRLRLGKEASEIRDRLHRMVGRDGFDLQERWAVRPRDISQHLLETSAHVIHFSGHGAGTPGLCFEDEAGKVQLVTADALQSLFALFTNSVKCVVLNACYSEEQAKAIVKHIDFVVGMNDSVDDRSAIAFAFGFYQALGAGRSVREAFQFGKAEIRLENLPGADIPVLHEKPGNSTMPHTPPTRLKVNRSNLVALLDGLDSTSLTSVVNHIDGAARHDNQNQSVPARVQSLLSFAESTVGCGLNEVAHVVMKLFPNTTGLFT